MRIAAVDLILIALFLWVAYALSRPFVAARYAGDAARLAAAYRWPAAERAFTAAIEADPADAAHAAAYADFLLRTARHLDRPLPVLTRAVALYDRALELNGRSAWYAVARAEARIAAARQYIDLSTLAGERRAVLAPAGEALLRQACADLRRAAANDPYGLPVLHATVYAALANWRFLTEDERLFATERIRRFLTLRPDQGRYVYPRLWQRSPDLALLLSVTPDTLGANRALYAFMASRGLWKMRAELERRIERCRGYDDAVALARERALKRDAIAACRSRAVSIVAAPSQPTAYARIRRQDWRGTSRDGKRVFKGGEVHLNGTVYGVLYLPPGRQTVRISLRGTKVAGVWPHVVIEADGVEIYEADVDDTRWKDHFVTVAGPGGLTVMSVTFLNDGWNATTKEDRNLFVGAAETVPGGADGVR